MTARRAAGIAAGTVAGALAGVVFLPLAVFLARWEYERLTRRLGARR